MALKNKIRPIKLKIARQCKNESVRSLTEYIKTLVTSSKIRFRSVCGGAHCVVEKFFRTLISFSSFKTSWLCIEFSFWAVLQMHPQEII